MRCSRSAFNLCKVTILWGAIGIALAGVRTTEAACRGMNPTWEEAANGAESGNDGDAAKAVMKLLSLRTYILPAPYQMAIAHAGQYIAKVGKSIYLRSLSSNSLFFANKVGIIENASVEDSPSSHYQPYQGGFKDIYRLKSCWSYRMDREDISNAARQSSRADLHIQKALTDGYAENEYAVKEFDAESDNALVGKNYEYASEGYSLTRFAADAYALKYGMAATNGGENASEGNSGEWADIPQAAQKTASSEYGADADAWLNRYLGIHADVDVVLPSANLDFSRKLSDINHETASASANAPLPGFFAEDRYDMPRHGETVLMADGDHQDSPSEEKFLVHSTLPKKLMTLLFRGFFQKTNFWTEAFHRTAKQFSLVRVVF